MLHPSISEVAFQSPHDIYLRAIARRRVQEQQESIARARAQESQTSNEDAERRVREATASPWVWLRNYTKTFNPHWVEERRSAPNEPFPDKPYFEPMLDLINLERVTAWEKSRDMMVSWAIVGYFTFQAMTVPSRQVVFQTMTDDKMKELVGYAQTLYNQQPKWLQDRFPLTKPKQPTDRLEFFHGGEIIGVAGGGGQLRSYHPWGYFLDEVSFISDAKEALSNALGGGIPKIVLNSSAGIGWYSDYRKDDEIKK